MAKVIIKKVPEAKSGSKLSAAKAREILHDGTVHGKKLTEKQRRFFGWKASKKAEGGTTIPIDSNTMQFNGNPHSRGGMDITYGGQTVEVEGGETGYQSPVDDSLHIMGNMINPITGRKFKQDSKKLASKERKLEELLDTSMTLISENDPFDKWGMLKFNAGAAMGKGSIRKKREIASSKEWLATLQKAMLDKSEELGVDPQNFSKGKLTKAKYCKKISYQNGGQPKAYNPNLALKDTNFQKWYKENTLEGKRGMPYSEDLTYDYYSFFRNNATGSIEEHFPDTYKRPNHPTFSNESIYSTPENPGGYWKGDKYMKKGKFIYNYGGKIKAQDGAAVDPGDDYAKIARAAATKYGVDAETIVRLMRLESGINPKVRASNKGALGIMQFMEGTAKQYGISKAKLKSTNPKDVAEVIDAGIRHFKDLLNNNNGDYKLALAAYNGGQGAVNFVKKKLGKKDITGDEWIEFMSNRQETSPSKDKHAWQNETLDYVTNIIATDDADFNAKRTEFNKKYYQPDYDKVREDIKKKYKIDLPNDPTIIENVKNYVDKYNPDKVQVQDYTLSLQEPKQYDRPTNRKGLSFEQIIPELYTFATNREEPVWMQQYNPQLLQPYQVSFQDRLNENQATFSALTRAVKDNPAALGSLAAQKYLADSGVLGEEFRTNQAIEADVTNKNIALLNDAQLKNLSLADQQYVRQSEAKSKTKAQNIEVLKSVADKLVLNRYEQLTQGIYENLYPHYAFDPNSGEVQKVGAPGQEYLNWQGNENMGMMGDQKVSTTYDPVTGQPKRMNVTTNYPSVTQLNEQRLKEQKATSIARRLKTNLDIFGTYPLWNRKR